MRRDDRSERGPRRPRFAEAKFAPPRAAPQPVPRPHLTGLVERGARIGLSLVVGSAGSGKTTVLLEWVGSRSPDEVCWLNVDEADAAPTRFWQGVIRSVQARHQHLGREALDLIDADGTVGADALEALADDFADLDSPITLVIEDLHLAHGAVDRPLGHLIARRPEPLALVISSRAEPRFDLGRLRADDAVVEVRDRDLLLGLEESRELLDRLGVSVDDATLGRLWEQTEGWAAGVHLAGLALLAADDPGALVDHLVSSSWAISHYLTTEVLAAQPPEVLDFLLDTSVVDELTPDLAARLTPGSSIGLADIEAAQLLLYRNSAHPDVFRYHHMLRDQLRLRLAATERDRERDLHRVAAAWYESTGDVGQTFRHLWRADERDDAIQLISRNLYDAYAADSLPTVDVVLTDADILGAPGAAIRVATALCMRHDHRDAEQLADRIESLAGRRLDEDARVELAALRIFLAAHVCDMERVIRHRDEIRLNDGWSEPTRTGHDCAITGLVRAHAWAHDWVAADAAALEVELDGAPSVPSMEMSAALACLELLRGRLGASLAHSQRLADMIDALEMDRLSITLPLLALQGSALLERGDTDEAERLLRRVEATDEYDARLPARISAAVALGRLRGSRGDAEGARTTFERARDRLAHLDETSWVSAYVNAQAAKVFHALGDDELARKLTDALPDGIARDLALVRRLVADGDLDDASLCVAHAAERADCLRAELEVALARLSVAVAAGAPTAELAEDVLALAAHEGFVFLLAEAGGDVFEEIRQQARHLPRTEFLDTILATVPHVPAAVVGRPLVEPLSEREIVVLRHLATSMSYREIAQELFISVNTLKSHVKHTFRKLGASSRDEALARARQAGYL